MRAPLANLARYGNSAPVTSATTFGPLAHRPFARLMAGVLLANLGNYILSVAAAWELTAAGQPADVVALVQTAVTLPMLLLALPAGALADMHDRRRIVLAAQGAMLVLSLILAALVFGGRSQAWSIVALTALVSSGTALFSPAVGASIRGAVPPAQLAAAVALNILVFNTARTIGPGIGGAIVSAAGAGTAFVANAACYALTLAIFAGWKPAGQAVPERKSMVRTIDEGLRAAAATREVRTVLLRGFAFTFTGAAIWALMPLVAVRLLGGGPQTFGSMYGALGLGAVIGAMSATWFRNRFSAEAITAGAGMVFGASMIAVSQGPGVGPSFALLVVGGAGWVQALSGFSVAAQIWSPHQVVGRIVAMANAVTFGGIAFGSWVWGHFAEWQDVATALLVSGGLMIVLPVLGLLAPMPAHAPRKGG
ncbi:MFS transporter [Tsuneonella sp. HG222]